MGGLILKSRRWEEKVAYLVFTNLYNQNGANTYVDVLECPIKLNMFCKVAKEKIEINFKKF